MTTLRVDNKQLSDFRRCPQLWSYAHREHLVRLEESEHKPAPLAFGHGIHKGLDVLYITRDVEAAVAAFHADYVYDVSASFPDKIRTPERGEEMLRAYAEHSKDFLGNMELLECEHYFEFKLGQIWYEDDPPTDVSYCGIIDKIVLDKRFDKIVGIDHKTTSRMMSAWLQAIRISSQFKGYLFYISQHSQWREQAGDLFWIDILSTAKTSSVSDQNIPFHRESLLCDEKQLMEWKEATLGQVKLLLKAESLSTLPKNTDQCDAFMRLCGYYPLCAAPLELRETVKGIDYVEGPAWDPKERD